MLRFGFAESRSMTYSKTEDSSLLLPSSSSSSSLSEKSSAMRLASISLLSLLCFWFRYICCYYCCRNLFLRPACLSDSSGMPNVWNTPIFLSLILRFCEISSASSSSSSSSLSESYSSSSLLGFPFFYARWLATDSRFDYYVLRSLAAKMFIEGRFELLF